MRSKLVSHEGKQTLIVITDRNLFEAEWPKVDESMLVKNSVEIVLQINGKVRDKMNVPADLSKEDLEKTVLADEKAAALTAGKTVVKVIAVPGRLVNIVVR